MTELHGWCRPCEARVDHEDILEHASREHSDWVELSLVPGSDLAAILDYCDAVVVD
jgi:hypothetical protein